MMRTKPGLTNRSDDPVGANVEMRCSRAGSDTGRCLGEVTANMSGRKWTEPDSRRTQLQRLRIRSNWAIGAEVCELVLAASDLERCSPAWLTTLDLPPVIFGMATERVVPIW
jgi:hypothetical protein